MKHIFIFAIVIMIGSISSFAQTLITGATTLGTNIVLVPESTISISDLVGSNKINFGLVTLDGRKNQLELDLAAISSEMNLETGGGNIKTDFRILQLVVASEGYDSRHWVGIEGSIGQYRLGIELDFVPGMSAITGSAASAVTNTPYTLRLIDTSTGHEKCLTGISSKSRWWR